MASWWLTGGGTSGPRTKAWPDGSEVTGVMDWPATARTLSRRRLLAASTTMLPLLAAVSCGVPDPLAGPPSPSRDVRTLRASISAEQALADAYRKVLGMHPGLSASLRPFLTQHEDHLAQLQSRLIVPPHAAASPSASPSASASVPPPPASAGAAVLLLGNAERGAAAAQVRRLASATPSLAQLLASIAASEATHAVALSALKLAGGA
jgi:hypothetical protein